MKPFIIVDDNVPMQFFGNCVGCILDKRNKDRVMVLTAEGESYPVGIDLLHFFSVQLYRKVMEAWMTGGVLFIPDLSGIGDDEMRQVLMDLKVVDREEGMEILKDYMEKIKKL